MASAEWEEMFAACVEGIRTRIQEKEATPWAIVCTDSEGSYYLLELNSASPHFVQRLLVQTLVKLQEWVDRHPQIIHVVIPDPEGGPQE